MVSKLSIGERVILIRWFENRKFNFVDAVLCKSILKKLEVTSDDITKYNIASPDNNTITWDKSVPDAEFLFTGNELNFIKNYYFSEKSAKQLISQKDLLTAEQLFGSLEDLDI